MASVLERNEQTKSEPQVRYHQKPVTDKSDAAHKDAKKAPVVFTDWASI